MKSKKILVISQYFYPEQFRINDMCEEWVKKGYKVTVLTGIPNYPQGDFYEGYNLRKKRSEFYKGIEIIRLPIIPRKKNSIMLALNYLSFVISGKVWSIFNKNEYDLVYIYEVSPMTQALPGISISKKLKVPCYIYVMDLWPENFEIITGINNVFVKKILNKMVDYIYANCSKIFTASKSFKKNIESRGVKPSNVIYWPQYAEEFYTPTKAMHELIPQDDKINITFAGNIGEAQGLSILPEIGKKIKDESLNLRFNIVGEGRYKHKFIEQIKENSLEEYFNFIDLVPAIEIPRILNASDFSLITLKKNDIFSMTIPAKLQSSMACGKAILLSADGESQKVLAESSAGLYSDAGDIESLLENIRKICSLNKEEIEKMNQNSQNYYIENFKKAKLMDIMDEFLLGDG